MDVLVLAAHCSDCDAEFVSFVEDGRRASIPFVVDAHKLRDEPQVCGYCDGQVMFNLRPTQPRTERVIGS